MPISKAQQRATAKYTKANYDRIELKVPKGRKEEIRLHAVSLGDSLNGFIIRAIDEAILRDTSTEKE